MVHVNETIVIKSSSPKTKGNVSKLVARKIQDGEWCGRDRANMVEEPLGDMQHKWNMACQGAV